MKNKKNSLKPLINLILSTKIPKVALIFGLLASVIKTLAGLIIPLLTKDLIDSSSISSLNVHLIVAMGLAFIVQAIISGFSFYLLSAIGQKIVANLRKRVWFKIIRLPVSYFDNTSSGETVSRLINDTGVVRGLVSRDLPGFITSIISITGAVTILFIMDWKMTLLILISTPVTLAIIIPLGKQTEKISRGLQDETAIFMGYIQQTIGEIRLMKASTAEENEETKGTSGINKLLSLGLREARISALIEPILQFVMMLVVVVIISYGAIQVSNNSMSTGKLVAFLIYLFQILMPINNFAVFFTALQRTKGATERIIDILRLPLEDDRKGIDEDITNKSLRVSGISFAYSDNEPVLKEISFEAHPGKMIAFVGPSGSGKSTILGIIDRFYEPSSGDVQIGGISTKDLSIKSLRSQIGYVFQENAMITGTIRENLCYGLNHLGEIPDKHLWEVTRLAYADEFIRCFPDGLDTEVGERGVKLSGGQRQRIAIARAFLRDPKILMMDEATASLDSQSERIIQQTLYKLMKNRTTLVIAHRLSTIVSADEIIFIENGQVTGKGTHQELSQTHSLYRKFVEQQLA